MAGCAARVWRGGRQPAQVQFGGASRRSARVCGGSAGPDSAVNDGRGGEADRGSHRFGGTSALSGPAR